MFLVCVCALENELFLTTDQLEPDQMDCSQYKLLSGHLRFTGCHSCSIADCSIKPQYSQLSEYYGPSCTIYHSHYSTWLRCRLFTIPRPGLSALDAYCLPSEICNIKFPSAHDWLIVSSLIISHNINHWIVKATWYCCFWHYLIKTKLISDISWSMLMILISGLSDPFIWLENCWVLH